MPKDPPEPATSPHERSIRVPRRRLLSSLLTDLPSSDQQRDELSQVASLMERVYLLETQSEIEALKDLYWPWSPENPETAAKVAEPPTDRKARRAAAKAEKQLKKSARSKRAGFSDVPSSDDPGLIALRSKLAWLLERANFSPVTQEELEFALEENHVFDLDLEVDWNQFEDPPLIHVRGRTVQRLQGRFLAKKLRSYLLRGTLGVMLIGAIMIGLSWVISNRVLEHGGPTQVFADPGIELARTFSPLQEGEFQLKPPITSPGRKLVWELLVKGPDGKAIELPEDGSRGWKIDGSTPDRIRYRAPDFDSIPPDGFDLVADWHLLDSDGQLLRKKDHLFSDLYRVEREIIPPEFSSPLRHLATVLMVLGIGGMLAGLFNFLRGIGRRRRAEAAPVEDSAILRSARSRHQGLKCTRFSELFRVESIEGESFREVFIASKTQDLPFYRLQLLRDIPLADLELVLPHTRPRVRLFDRAMVAIGFLVSALMMLFRLLIIFAATVLSFGLGAIVALANAGGLATRSWNRFRNTVNRLSSAVTESLADRMTGSNLSIIHTLADDVQDQEFKEAMLAYAFLAAEPEGLTPEALDSRVETWLAKSLNQRVDYEVADGLAKLRSLGLLASHQEQVAKLSARRSVRVRVGLESGDHPDFGTGEKLRVVSPSQATEILRTRLASSL